MSLTDKQISFLQEIVEEKRAEILDSGDVPSVNWIAIKGIRSALSRAVYGEGKRREMWHQ